MVLRARLGIRVKWASYGKQWPSSSARSARAAITSFCAGVTDSAQATPTPARA